MSPPLLRVPSVALRRLILAAVMLVSSVTSHASVSLSSYTFPLSSRPTISTNESLSGSYRLRAKFLGVPDYPDGFHAATAYGNQGQPLNALPPAGIYAVDLYWVTYDGAGSPTVGPMQRVTVMISASYVSLASHSFNVGQPPTIDTNNPLTSRYRLRAKFIDGSQYGYHAANQYDNNHRVLDNVANLPAGTYQTVALYWVQYDATGNTIWTIGPEQRATVSVANGSVNLTSYFSHRSQPPAITTNEIMPAYYALRARILGVPGFPAGYQAAEGSENAGRLLKFDAIPPGRYQVELSWIKYSSAVRNDGAVGGVRTASLTVVDGPVQVLNVQDYIGAETWDEDDDGNRVNIEYSTRTYPVFVAGSGDLRIWTTGFLDTYGGVAVQTAESGGDGENFALTVPITFPGTYYVSVSARQSGDFHVYGELTPTGLAPPTPFTEGPTAVSGTGFTANWYPVATAARYEVDVATDAAFGSRIGSTASSAAHALAVTNLTPGSTYYYRVRAVNGVGISGWSTFVRVTTSSGPPVARPATNVGATVFTANWDGVSSAAYYELDVARNDTFATLVSGYHAKDVGNGTSFLVTGLTAGETYYYRLRAVTASGGISANSGTIAVRMGAADPVRLALQYWRGNDHPNIAYTTTGPVWFEEEEVTDYEFNGEEDVEVGSHTEPAHWGEGEITAFHADGQWGSRWSASGTDYNVMSPSSIYRPSATIRGYAAAEGYRLHDKITFRTWGFSPTNNCHSYSARLYSPSGALIGLSSFGNNNYWEHQFYPAPTGAGVYRVEISYAGATGVQPTSGTVTYYLPVDVYVTRPLIANAEIRNLAVGAGVTGLSVAASGSGPFVYGATNLPPGLVIDSGSGVITGIPTVFGTFETTLSAANAAGTSYKTVQFVVSFPAPKAFAAQQIGPRQFLGSWSPLPGALEYRLDVSTNPGFSTFILNNFSVTFMADGRISPASAYVVRNLQPDTSYYYRVRAVTAAGVSVNSNPMHVRTSPLASSAMPASLWIDVPADLKMNGVWTKVYDGVLDEIIPGESARGLSYYIVDWRSSSLSVSFYDEPNDWWYMRNSFIDRNEDGVIDDSAPNFTWQWRPSLTLSFGETMYLRIGVEFLPEPGQLYDICYSKSDVISGASLLRQSSGGGPLIFESNARQIFTLPGEFELSELDRGSLYLVRHTFAPAGVQVHLPLLGQVTLRKGPGGLSGAVTVLGDVSIEASASSATISKPNAGSVTVSNGQVSGSINLGGGYVISGVVNGRVTLSTPGGASISTGPGGTTLTLPGNASIAVSSSGAISMAVPSGLSTILKNVVTQLGLPLGLGGLGGPTSRAKIFPQGTSPDLVIWENGPGLDIGNREPGNYTLGISEEGAREPAPVVWISVTVTPPAAMLAVDGNRDGQIRFDASDRTSVLAPYKFWLNDDIDRGHVIDGADFEQDDISPAEAVVNGWTEDWKYNRVQSRRDMEDFSRIVVATNGILDGLKNGELYLGLRWENTLGTPSIKLYKQYDASGSTSYLTDDFQASLQLPETAILNQRFANDDVSGMTARTVVLPDDLFVLPQSMWVGVAGDAPKRSLLFEGCTAGAGHLKVVVLKRDGSTFTEMSAREGIWLDLRNIQNMYEHWTVGHGPVPYGGGAPSALKQASAFTYTGQSPEALRYVLFVHGWNMEPWEKERFAETAYKRLYWQGYNGRFGLFSWPTTNGFDGLRSVITDSTNYDRGEFSAWRSANLLAQKLVELSILYPNQVYLFAHSMGNVVAGEALRRAAQNGFGTIVRTYVASQAALPAQCYNGSLADNLDANVPVNGALRALDGGWPRTANAYKNWLAANAGSVGRRVNFFNVNDFALGRDVWELNQWLKPDHPDFSANSPDPQRYYAYLDDFNQPPTQDGFGWRRPGGQIDISDRPYLNNTWYAVLRLGNAADTKDRYEIMSMAAEARSKALGVTDVGGGLEASFSLASIWPVDPSGDTRPYSRRKWHSAQFRSTNMLQKGYWQALLGPQGFNIGTQP